MNKKLKRVEELKKLANTDVSCKYCETTIPMEFSNLIRTSWHQPTKAKFCCKVCTGEQETFYSKPTYFNRFSILIVNPIVH
jgi:hypothetical protein